MVDERIIDLADVCQEVLSRPGRRETVPRNKPRKEKVKSDTAISDWTYLVCKEGDAKFEGLKMEAVGFDKKRQKQWHYINVQFSI